jgi:hypothetical protein
MAKTWLLDSETKGTGAHVLPLDAVLKKPTAERDLALVELERPTRAQRVIKAPGQRTFKVVDVMSARVLAEGVSAAETVELLERARSVVDVRVYVWMREARRWRLLSLQEQKALWGFRRKQLAGVAR